MESLLVMTLVFFESSRLGQPSFKRQNYIAVLFIEFGGGVGVRLLAIWITAGQLIWFLN